MSDPQKPVTDADVQPGMEYNEPAPPHHDISRHLAVPSRLFDEDAADELPDDDDEIRLPEIHGADVACIAPLMVMSIYRTFFGFITFAWVKTHLVWLLIIRPHTPALIAAGAAVHAGALPVWLPLLVPLPYLFFDDPFVYWAGRRYGDRLSSYMIEQNPKLEKWLAWSERLMQTRWGPIAIVLGNLFPLPVLVLYFVAGDSRMNFGVFAVSDLIGIALSNASIVGLGYLLGNDAQAVVDVIGRYSSILVYGTIVLTIVLTVRRTRRNMRVMREREAAKRGR